MKYLLLLLLWGYNAGAQVVGDERIYDNVWFTGAKPDTFKCKHIYVAVVPDTVYESSGASGGPSYGFGPRPTGKNLICVKCHHITAQMITTEYPSGRSKVVPVDSVKMWLGYSPIKSGSGYKLFWHPGLRRLSRYYEPLIFGSGSGALSRNHFPGGISTGLVEQ